MSFGASSVGVGAWSVLGLIGRGLAPFSLLGSVWVGRSLGRVDGVPFPGRLGPGLGAFSLWVRRRLGRPLGRACGVPFPGLPRRGRAPLLCRCRGGLGRLSQSVAKVVAIVHAIGGGIAPPNRLQHLLHLRLHVKMLQ